MNFLTPLFLLGAIAIAGPVIFHLVRRTTRERTPFSSLLFLQPTPPRLTRRSRIEHWLLLMLRCLALGFLAFGFARPFFPRTPANLPTAHESKRVVLLVDTSASIQRAGAWNAAQERALEWGRKLDGIDELALVTFARSTLPRFRFSDWKATAPGERLALLKDRLASAEPGWLSTQLGTALMDAAELLNEPSQGLEPRIRQIVLISDLQQGGHAESLQSYEWPRGIEVIVDPVRVKPAGNASLQWVEDDPALQPGTNTAIRVRISNTSDATIEQFEVGWAPAPGVPFVGSPLKAYVPPGQSKILSLPLPAGTVGQRVELRGDAAPFDNALYVVPPPPARARVLYVGDDIAAEPRFPFYFLRRAFPEGVRPTVDWTLRTPASLTATEARTAAGLTLVTAALPASTATALRLGAEAGGTVFLVMSGPGSTETLGTLLETAGLKSQESIPGQFALLGEMESRHPLFAPFSDPRFADFTKIRLWKHRKLDLSTVPNARVLIRLDDGNPALIEVPVGRGRVLAWTSGWHTDDTQWPLSTKFVPFLLSLLEYSGALPAASSGQTWVGDALTLPALQTPAERRLRFPNGREQVTPPGETRFTDTLAPGIYSLSGSSSATAFAVNLDPSESRTVPMATDDLERLGVPLARPETQAADAVVRREELHASEAEARQKLWRWFLGATLGATLRWFC